MGVGSRTRNGPRFFPIGVGTTLSRSRHSRRAENGARRAGSGRVLVLALPSEPGLKLALHRRALAREARSFQGERIFDGRASVFGLFRGGLRRNRPKLLALVNGGAVAGKHGISGICRAHFRDFAHAPSATCRLDFSSEKTILDARTSLGAALPLLFVAKRLS
jgi:hypothetical protein